MAKYHLTFTDEDCKGCGLCANFCMRKILYLDDERINKAGYNLISVTDMSLCVGCSYCAIICPDSVIEVRKNG